MREFVGSITLEIDTKEVEIVGMSVREITGNKPVRVMNKLGKVAGVSSGLKHCVLDRGEE